MQDYLSVKSLLPKNCTISSNRKLCQSTTHFCRCSTDKTEIIPTTSSCLAGPQIPSQEQCSTLFRTPPAITCDPPSEEQCSELYPQLPASTCAPTLSQVECATPELKIEGSTCTPCPSQETVTFNSPTDCETFQPRLVTESLPAETETLQTIVTNSANEIRSASGEDIKDDNMHFVNGFVENKKDLLILILSGLNIFQCAIIIICEMCRVCEGGDKKAVKDLESVSNDSVALDKRVTCDASDYMNMKVPVLELTAGNFGQIEAEAQFEQVQELERFINRA